jgi:hypothetical protein
LEQIIGLALQVELGGGRGKLRQIPVRKFRCLNRWATVRPMTFNVGSLGLQKIEIMLCVQ